MPILKNYLNFFSIENLLVLFTEELEKDPHKVVYKIFRFINAKDDFIPSNLGERYYASQSDAFLKTLVSSFSRYSFFKSIWHYIPNSKHAEIFRWIEKTHYRFVCKNRNNSKKLEIDNKTYKILVKYYQEDIELLEKIIGMKVPWVF